MGAPKSRRAGLVFIAITLWLDMVAQSISFPILPRLAQELVGGDAAAAARWVGYLEVAWAIPQVLAAPLLGLLSDRFGRRPVILVSVFGVGAELVMGALAPTIWWLLAARILCGFTCGAMAASMAYVADVTAPEDRTSAYGWMNVAMWSGIILGPALGGLLAIGDLRLPFWVAAGFAALGGLYGLLVLPESLPAGSRAPMRWSVANPLSALGLLGRTPTLALLGAAYLLLWLAFQGKDNMMVLYTAHRYGWTAWAFGVFAAALAVGSIAVGGLAGWTARRLGDERTVVLGLALEVVGYVGMGLASTGLLFWAANLPAILGGVASPALQSMMSQQVGADEQGQLQGARASISSLTSVIAPISFTQLFAWTIAPGRPASWSGATILIGALLTLVALGLTVMAGRRRLA